MGSAAFTDICVDLSPDFNHALCLIFAFPCFRTIIRCYFNDAISANERDLSNQGYIAPRMPFQLACANGDVDNNGLDLVSDDRCETPRRRCLISGQLPSFKPWEAALPVSPMCLCRRFVSGSARSFPSEFPAKENLRTLDS